MAFEQFFYNGTISLETGGKSDHCQGERVWGGSFAGGSAQVEITPALDNGGILCSGSATINTSYNPTPSGGFNERWPNIGENEPSFTILGIITEEGSGGALVGGSHFIKVRYKITASGGAIAGGNAHSVESREAGGGILVGGKAFVYETDEEIGSGGILVGGKVAEEPPISGGVVGGGSSIPVIVFQPFGGVKLGGISANIYLPNPLPSGGVVLNGDPFNRFNPTVSGGVVAGGINEAAESSIVGVKVGGKAVQTFNEVATGGVVGGGIAPVGTTEFPAGGSKAGGKIIQRITQHIDVSGVVVGGKVEENPPVSGGIKVGGDSRLTDNVISEGGGVVTNGFAIAGIKPGISGGVVLSGLARVGEQPVTSGGAVLGGKAFITFNEFGSGGAVVGGAGVDNKSAWHYTSDGNFVQVSQRDIIYKITSSNFVYVVDTENENAEVGKIVGNATVSFRYFGQSIPKFSFGKTPAKNEACRNFRDVIRQPTVLSMTRTQTREFLEKLSPEDWEVTSFDPKKREACILIDSGVGGTHLITVELLLVDSGVGSP